MSNAGLLYVVATPIGNLEDFSPRAQQVLREVDLILAEDTRHTRGLCQRFGIDTRLKALHEHNEVTLAEGLAEQLLGGARFALVSDAGTPLLSDPGFPLLRACRERGVPVSPVPGPSALTAALSVSGLATDRFCFEGFLPRQAKARSERLNAIAASSATLVLYESVHRVEQTLTDLAKALGEQRQATLGRELTKVYEQIVHGSLAQLRAQVADNPEQRKGEFVLVIAGAEEVPGAIPSELDQVLQVLLAELPVKQASALAARLTGASRNACYQRALELHDR